MNSSGSEANCGSSDEGSLRWVRRNTWVAVEGVSCRAQPGKKPSAARIAVDARAVHLPPKSMRIFRAAACGIGMNAAVAYMVLARFSQRDNRTTAASVHAVEHHTGVARSRAKVAVDALIQGKLLRQVREGSRPLYDLTPSPRSRKRSGPP